MTAVAALAAEAPTPPLNWLFATQTFGTSGGVTWSFAFEPLASVMLSHSAARECRHSSHLCPLAKLDFQRCHLPKRPRVAEHKGVLRKFEYPNYAGPHQQPLASYGANSLDFLREVRNKYDPTGVFQSKVPGGFKLW
ncbi:hypothetical protein ACQKWADRAFT_206613 [Trichoderma austrokoningii]